MSRRTQPGSTDRSGDSAPGAPDGYTPEGQRCWSASGTFSNSCSSPPAGATIDSWNAYGELCSVGPNLSTSGCTGNTTPTAGDTSYTYDAEGLRATETNPSGVTEVFTYETASRPGLPLILTDGSDAYVYGPATFGQATPPLAEISLATGTGTDIISNPQGPVALTTSNGVSGTYTYSTYGQQTVRGAAVAFGFQGAYQGGSGFSDGLLYMVNRYYDPTVGQSVSVDPMLAETGQPYEYAGDQPADLSDPTGQNCQQTVPYGTTPTCGLGNGNNGCIATYADNFESINCTGSVSTTPGVETVAAEEQSISTAAGVAVTGSAGTLYPGGTSDFNGVGSQAEERGNGNTENVEFHCDARPWGFCVIGTCDQSVILT